MKILQSNEDLKLSGRWDIQAVVVNPPDQFNGGSGRTNAKPFSRRLEERREDFLLRMRSLIEVRESDGLCMVKALLIAAARAEYVANRNDVSLHRRYKLLTRKDRPAHIKKEAISLLKKANLPTNLSSYSVHEHLPLLVNALAVDRYRVVVYSDEEKRVIQEIPEFNTAQSSLKTIFLLHFFRTEGERQIGHFNVLTSLRTIQKAHSVCPHCFAKMRKTKRHRCPRSCDCCKQPGSYCRFSGGPRIRCTVCQLQFYNSRCFEQHKAICRPFERCFKCFKLFQDLEKHQNFCHGIKCALCKQQLSDVELQDRNRHICYIVPEPPVPRYDKFNCWIWYDFETKYNAQGEHIPALCCALKKCLFCVDNMFGEKLSQRCAETCRAYTFYGENCAEEFCKFLFEESNSRCVVIAHNASAYDTYLILPYLYRHKIPMTQLQRDGRFLQIEIDGGKIRLLDSYLFLFAPLRKLGEMFGLPTSKSFFPHKAHRVGEEGRH